MQQVLQDELRDTVSTSKMTLVRLLTPDHHYFDGEPISVLIYPPDAQEYDLKITQVIGKEELREHLTQNHIELKPDLPVGRYNIQARWRNCDDTDGTWSEWSKQCPIEIHVKQDQNLVKQLRRWEHRLSLIVDYDINGVGMVNDPLAFPPSYPVGEQTLWFRSPVYEGSPTLLNECADFYRDPKAYFLNSIKRLVDRGFGFTTWHDLIDGNCGNEEKRAIIQFDMDGGPNSMARLIDPLIELGVRGSIMIHNEANDWYEYKLLDLDLDALKRAEAAGWCIGYHNNALGNVQRLDRLGDYSYEVLAEAAKCFVADVDSLRQHFDIRTYTNHGGNVLNHRLDMPAEANVICVDRTNTEIWKPVNTMFSDGGFTARPAPLGKRVEKLEAGLHFFRIHPVKYANWYEPWDFPPLVVEDAVARQVEITPELKSWLKIENEKQYTWLEYREQFRLGVRKTHASANKPLSSKFMSMQNVPQIAEHYNQRQKVFVREYPAINGDPRVFWWRLLHAFAPKNGEILNVGALPPDRRSETTDFLSQAVSVIEMDIDEKRKPHILGDVTEPPEECFNRYTGVLLFGLGCIHSPSKAVQACFDLAAPGAVGLFGFPDNTHPLRGEMWRPDCRFNWKLEREPLHDIGVRQNLWSFDPDCLEELFSVWPHVTIENFSHYWFVVCKKQ